MFGQNCFCDKDTLLKELIHCDVTTFDNKAKIYWNFNCDSSWLTFERPTREKIVIFSLSDGLQNMTGRLDFTYAQEYKSTFLIRNFVISGCCDPPEYYLFDKTNAQIRDSLGCILFYGESKKLPFIIGFTGSKYAINDYRTVSIYNVNTRKKYIIKLLKGDINKALEATDTMFPENLFDEPIVKGTKVYLTYLLNKSKSQKIRKTRTLIIDLNKYSH